VWQVQIQPAFLPADQLINVPLEEAVTPKQLRVMHDQAGILVQLNRVVVHLPSCSTNTTGICKVETLRGRKSKAGPSN